MDETTTTALRAAVQARRAQKHARQRAEAVRKYAASPEQSAHELAPFFHGMALDPDNSLTAIGVLADRAEEVESPLAGLYREMYDRYAHRGETGLPPGYDAGHVIRHGGHVSRWFPRPLRAPYHGEANTFVQHTFDPTRDGGVVVGLHLQGYGSDLPDHPASARGFFAKVSRPDAEAYLAHLAGDPGTTSYWADPASRAGTRQPVADPVPHLRNAAQAVTGNPGTGERVRLARAVRRYAQEHTHADFHRAIRANPHESVPYAAYRAPAGGTVVRGTFYQGGKLIPDLEGKFANPPEQPAKLARDDVIAKIRDAVKRRRGEKAALVVSYQRAQGVRMYAKKPKALYRGISPETGTKSFRQGKGLYVTTNPKTAAGYGEVQEVPLHVLPKNPLVVRSEDAWDGWLIDQYVNKLGMKNVREFNAKYPDPGEYVRSLGYDGVQIGDGGPDTTFVSYHAPKIGPKEPKREARTVFRWKTLNGDTHRGELVDMDNGTGIMRMTDGKERAVRIFNRQRARAVRRYMGGASESDRDAMLRGMTPQMWRGAPSADRTHRKVLADTFSDLGDEHTAGLLRDEPMAHLYRDFGGEIDSAHELSRQIHEGTPLRKLMDRFTQNYVHAALWSSTDDAGEPLDANHDLNDIHPDTLAAMIADAHHFRAEHGDYQMYSDGQQDGHNFWLSRNGHGAGFHTDDSFEPDEQERLHQAASRFGEYDLHVGDDGMIHGSYEAAPREPHEPHQMARARAVRRYAAASSDLAAMFRTARENPYEETGHGVIADKLEEEFPGSPMPELIRRQFGFGNHTEAGPRNNDWYEPVENSWDETFPYAARLGQHGPFNLYLRHEGGPEQNQAWVLHAVSRLPGSRDFGYTFEFPHEEAHEIPRMFPAAKRYINDAQLTDSPHDAVGLHQSSGIGRYAAQRNQEARRFEERMDAEERRRQ